MPTLKIALSNIRGKKSVAVSLGILIMLAAALFNVGLTLTASTGTLFDTSNEALNGAHYAIRFPGSTFEEKYLDFFLNDSRVEAAEAEEAIILDKAYYPEGGMIFPNMFNLENSRSIQGFTLNTLADVLEDEAIYIPGFMRGMGYTPGSTLILTFKKQELRFKVAGYVESTWFCSSLSTVANMYLTAPAYEALYAKVGGGRLLSVRFHDPADLADVREEFKNATGIKLEAAGMDAQVMEITVEDMKNGSTMLVSTISAIVLAFSLIIVLVVMVVIKFRINNHIETQMHNIGALEAMGYTPVQIKWSIALEFCIIGMAGVLAGVFASYAILNGLSSIISDSMGIPWKISFHPLPDFISAVSILAIILFVARKAANKAAKLTPITALRGGLTTHSFSKNHFPLDRTKGPLSLILALKSMFFQPGSYFMIALIFLGVSFASTFALISYWNMGVNDDMVIKMTGFEVSDSTVYVAKHANYGEVRQLIEQMPEVEQTSLFESSTVEVNDEMISCYLSDDFSRLKSIETYEGDLPKYDNEIVITGIIAKSMGKTVGDTIAVSYGDVSAEYVISGLSQSISNFGRQCFLSLEGIRRLIPSYQVNSIQVYLKDGSAVGEFIQKAEASFPVLSPSKDAGTEPDGTLKYPEAAKKAEEKLANLLTIYGVDSAQYALFADGRLLLFGDTSAYQIDHIEDNRQLFASSTSSVAIAISMMSALILAGTFSIVTLVLYMVIKSLIVRRRHELGIYKAIGYTSRQLMLQISLSFLPAAAAGILCGCITGILTIDSLMTGLLGSMGISHMVFSVPYLIIILFCAVLLLFSFLLSMLVSRKVQTISVYGLLTE